MNVLERKPISLMLLLELIMVNLSPISTANLLMAISTFTLSHVILVTQNLIFSHAKIIFSQALRMRRICSKKNDLVVNV